MSDTQLLEYQPRPSSALRCSQLTEQDQCHIGVQDERSSPGHHIRPGISSSRILEIVLHAVRSASLLRPSSIASRRLEAHFERVIYERKCEHHRLEEHKHNNEPCAREQSQLA